MAQFHRYIYSVALVILGLILSTIGLRYSYPTDLIFTLAGLVSALLGAAIFYGKTPRRR